MLLSMTGFGEARFQSDVLGVAVELRAVNNRYLKVSIRCPEPYRVWEYEIEKTIRQRIHRGTIQVQINVQRKPKAEDYQLNTVALQSYLDQLAQVEKELKLRQPLPLEGLITLPGVVPESNGAASSPTDDWEKLEPVLVQALERLQVMRADEGRAMERSLREQAGEIRAHLEQIGARAPQVTAAFRDRLSERLRVVLADNQLQLDESALVREVAVFAERSDITEEAVRLGSHLSQFNDFLMEKASPGRKLDFLIQEMFREINTIGSKANDVEIARHVVEIKGNLEKMRELIQNVE